MSNYYHTCPECGANLDPGEKCDCTDEAIANKKTARTCGQYAKEPKADTRRQTESH